uniref:Dr1-associated corepressor n=1 Tax=Fundulus heteroclitus TaxID=8078 RepID=A0A3Q2SXN4_FUNHE
MPSKKKKYNARFPPARIKKIMQTDEEIGKVAAAVPVIISRALELFLESLLTKACHVTQSRNAKTMTTSHLKQCIELEQQFDFLKDLVAAVPDMQGEGEENHTEGGGEKVPRRGRKPGSGRKNGGAGSKGKDKKLSGTESEQEVGHWSRDGAEREAGGPPVRHSHPPEHHRPEGRLPAGAQPVPHHGVRVGRGAEPGAGRPPHPAAHPGQLGRADRQGDAVPAQRGHRPRHPPGPQVQQQ